MGTASGRTSGQEPAEPVGSSLKPLNSDRRPEPFENGNTGLLHAKRPANNSCGDSLR